MLASKRLVMFAGVLSIFFCGFLLPRAVAAEKKPAEDVSIYSRVLYNVNAGNLQVAKGEPEKGLANLVADLKNWYSASFCGMDLTWCDSSGVGLQNTADRKGNYGFVLQVTVTDLRDSATQHFAVSHEMLVRHGNSWRSLFCGPARAIPLDHLTGNHPHGMVKNPALVPFLKAALPVKIEPIKDHKGPGVELAATIKNTLPFAVKEPRIVLVEPGEGPGSARIFRTPDGTVIGAGATSAVTATSPGRPHKHGPRMALVMFSFKAMADDDVSVDQMAAEGETPAKP